jgi:L-asparaginase II
VVRVRRNGVEESVHRADIVEVDATGRILRQLGSPERRVYLRSTVKPFALLALVEAGGIEAFDLEPAEIAVMASSHSGEDIHVRTIQALFRRSGISQALLACGAQGAPVDPLTAARLARDGEHASPIRHMCSGQHAVGLLLARMNGWALESYWQPTHPAQAAIRSVVARAFGTTPEQLVVGIDGCGLETFAFCLREVAQAFAMLADPVAVPGSDPRSALASGLTVVRDAMIGAPEMVAGRHDRLDTSLMKAAAGRILAKSGMEALRGIAILPGDRTGTSTNEATGLALKIEDGDSVGRASWSATIESLRQAGALDGHVLRSLARYHRPQLLDPHGRLAGEAVADFELAPVGELTN